MRDSLTGHSGFAKDEALDHLRFSPALRFSVAGAVGAGVLVALASAFLGHPLNLESVAISALLYGAMVAAFAVLMQRTYPHKRVGLCNLVTLARLVIVGVLAVAMLEAVPATTTLLILAVASLCLDGVDGWLARRQKLSSAFGARFDVEVDAAFALVLALYAARTDAAWLLVLLLGLPHYGFWAARSLLPWLNAPLPESFARKAICVLQIGILIALLVPFFGGVWLQALVVTAVAALVWSFGRDIIWLYRNRL